MALASDDPARAAAEARQALRDAAAAGDAGAQSTALRALGLAARESEDPVEAQRLGASAVAVAEQAGLTLEAAQARVTLALSEAYAGDGQRALVTIDRALEVLTGLEHARAMGQRALILQRLGDTAAALADHAAAVAELERHDDTLWLARVRSNRGILLAYAGDYEGAAVDLADAAEGFTAVGASLKAAQTRHNLAYMAARRGDVPAALAGFEEADRQLQALGHPRHICWMDRAETLLSVHLTAEARAAAARAVAGLAEHGMAADLAEARLLLARAMLADGDPAAAATTAAHAATELHAQGRTGWEVAAQAVAWQASTAAGQPVTAAAARRLADALEAAGWGGDAQQVRLAGGAALCDTDPSAARALLRKAARTPTTARAATRIRACHATALLRLGDRDPAGAARALAAGLREVAAHRETLGATELRAHASSLGQPLAELGVRLALAGGRPRRVLAWAERYRAGALTTVPARPPDDAALAADLARMRGVAADLRRATGEGQDAGGLRQELARLERRVRDRVRQVAAAPGPERDRPSAGALLSALGARALVEYVVADGWVHAVVLARDRAHLRRLGPVAPVAEEVDALRFALARTADPSRSGARLAAAAAAGDAAAAALSAALVEPLGPLLGGRPVVVVPTGVLQGIPWGVLPALAGRPLVVAPSALAWLRSDARRRPGTGGVVAVAGPGLEHAAGEVDAVAGCWTPRRPVRRLSGDAATVTAALDAMEGAAIAHFAAHGRFRGDNPQFSALELADGPLTVYDLLRLRRVPTTIVLSACETGSAAVHPGDELLGLAAALLQLGARSLIASTVPIPDAGTPTLMAALHGALAAGRQPAPALLEARAALGSDTPAAAAAAGAFLCLGAG